MQPQARFLAAVARKPVDRVPQFDFLFQRPLFQELIGRAPESYNARDAMELTRALGLDGVWIPYGCFAGWTPEKVSANAYKDEWGTTFEKNESSWPIDALHPLQRTAGMDLAEVKRKYGNRICLVGNIDSSRTLPYGSLKDVEQEVREAIAVAAPGYGYILASDHSLHDGIPVANIRRLFETGRKYGGYPLVGA